ncbi:carbonic anhydrase [Streptomyces sp. NBC_01511]|uniref:carbonic anhydrase n=1 Tax=unclassified Streptomyces TaxID=2593676 RepID=UPI0038679E36
MYPPHPGAPPTSPAAAEQLLFDVNQRWMAEGQTHPREDNVRRNEVAPLSYHQEPWAMILGCIDSRVPPELIFDQGLGDLFVSRTAGQVVDRAVYGSASYAAGISAVQLIVVLGHENCGAVSKAIEWADGSPPPGVSPHLKWLTDEITPAIPPAGTPNRLNLAINENVRRIRAKLVLEEPTKTRIAAGTLRVIGARYELGTWIVTKVN